jgi:(p)ppGpp synthase/HD superfamily hydrolase
MVKNRKEMPWHKLSVVNFAKKRSLDIVLSALSYAKGFYFLTRRKDGREEFIHSYRVAQILIFHGIRDGKILAEAILHDVLENINFLLFNCILQVFGERVALHVWIMSRRENEDNGYYFARIGEQVDTIILKLADRMHNLRNMTKNLGKNKFFTEERLEEQIDETWQYIVPMTVKAIGMNCKYKEAVTEMLVELLLSLGDARKAVVNK